MKAQLVKREDRYDLYNKDGHKIASTLDGAGNKLSLKNCQAIERGYDLDDLAKSVPHTCRNDEDWYKCRAGFIEGFQKALELMGDKKFSEQELIEAIADSWSFSGGITEYVKSLQKNEWEVEVEMWFHGTRHKKGEWIPKLDADGCLILKRI